MYPEVRVLTLGDLPNIVISFDDIPISSSVSRKAASFGVSSSFRMPPGKETSPLCCFTCFDLLVKKKICKSSSCSSKGISTEVNVKPFGCELFSIFLLSNLFLIFFFFISIIRNLSPKGFFPCNYIVEGAKNKPVQDQKYSLISLATSSGVLFVYTSSISLVIAKTSHQ